MKVLAAMSGGVDSAVAAARAAEAGHDVTGIHLALSRNPRRTARGARGCCTIEDANDARRAADVIGIPFYVWDLSERFHEDVVEDFMDEYAAGRTPNPCLRCNEKIKFAAVLDRALALGFDAVATGHYAQLRTGRRRPGRDAPRGRPRQGPVLRARRARPRSSSRTRCSRSATSTKAAGARGGRARAGCWSPTSPTATTSASSPTATPPAGCARSSATARPTTAATIVDDAPARCSGSHDGTYGFTDRPAQGPAARPARRRTASRASCSTSSRSRGTVTVGPRERARRRPAQRRSGRAGAARAPDARSRARVQLRAHGDEHRAGRRPSTATRRRGRAARPGVRHRARPGRRGLRRHPRGRLGDDREHGSCVTSSGSGWARWTVRRGGSRTPTSRCWRPA